AEPPALIRELRSHVLPGRRSQHHERGGHRPALGGAHGSVDVRPFLRGGVARRRGTRERPRDQGSRANAGTTMPDPALHGISASSVTYCPSATSLEHPVAAHGGSHAGANGRLNGSWDPARNARKTAMRRGLLWRVT